MLDKFYFVKRLSPWMMEELLSLSMLTEFKLVLFRLPDSFYLNDLDILKARGVNALIRPFSFSMDLNRIFFLFKFFIKYFPNFLQFYSFVIGIKASFWFLRINIKNPSEKISIHSQFATQAALVALMYKKYYSNSVETYFTFHAHDIYFNNKWFKVLTLNSENIFSISNYNIDYIKRSYGESFGSKILLSKLGAKRNNILNHFSKKSSNSTINLGFISWFVEKKGVFYLLDAFKLLITNGINVKLSLAGDGPLKKDILKFIRDNGLESYVHFYGKIGREDKVDFFSNIDIFVLPAISIPNDKDGIPVVLMEACSYGLPLISTNVSGIPEICFDDHNGLLINEKSTDELYNAIYRLSSDAVLRNKFSDNSLKVFEMYDIDLNTKFKARSLNWI